MVCNFMVHTKCNSRHKYYVTDTKIWTSSALVKSSMYTLTKVEISYAFQPHQRWGMRGGRASPCIWIRFYPPRCKSTAVTSSLISVQGSYLRSWNQRNLEEEKRKFETRFLPNHKLGKTVTLTNPKTTQCYPKRRHSYNFAILER